MKKKLIFVAVTAVYLVGAQSTQPEDTCHGKIAYAKGAGVRGVGPDAAPVEYSGALCTRSESAADAAGTITVSAVPLNDLRAEPIKFTRQALTLQAPTNQAPAGPASEPARAVAVAPPPTAPTKIGEEHRCGSLTVDAGDLGGTEAAPYHTSAIGKALALAVQAEEHEAPVTRSPASAPANSTATAATTATPTETATPSKPSSPPTIGTVSSNAIEDTGTRVEISLPTAAAGGATAQINSQVIQTLQEATVIGDTSRGVELVETATAARLAVQGAAAADQKTLAEPYRNLPVEAMGDYLQRAQGALSEAASALTATQSSSLDPSEIARFKNTMLNARDKASLGLEAIHDDQNREAQLGTSSPFTGLLGMKDANPMAKSAALAEIFGARLPVTAAATSDALVNRLVMYHGLPPEIKAQVFPRLKLAEHPTLTLAGGQTKTVTILHNGYILGGAGTALDCSSFVSSILPTDVRKGRFTTLDFHTMWRYRRTGVFPKPPQYSKDREKLVQETATAFNAIDLYTGEPLAVGDLLIYRILAEPIGHVFVVRSYNPVTLQTEVIEAAQSAGTVREREFQLSVDPLNATSRFIRPGLMALRLRPVANRACAYREHAARLPASQPSSGSDVPEGVAR